MRLFRTNSSKLLSISTHRLWVLVFIITLILLAALSRSKFGDKFAGYGFKSQAPTRVPSKGIGYPPVFAYWICGSKGDGKRILRLLKAIYHPRNQYLLQLDAGSSEIERAGLALSVESENVFKTFGNVDVVGESYPLDKMGSSALSAVLHAAALLLKIGPDWDWFIPLSASDYPLMTQDDLLHAFTFLPRELNFIDYASNTGWKERLKINQIVIDPNLYYRENTPLMYAVEMRTTPDAFKIFGGSPWTILTRSFLEHCVQGWENFPRKLLMFLTNVPFPLESYFHTVICNTPEFQNTTVNNDLRFMIWDNPTLTGEPQILKLPQYETMVTSGAAFARRFEEGDLVLEKIDQIILNRSASGVVPGKWCLSGPSKNNTDQEELCSTWGSNIDAVKPRSNGMKLRALLSKLAINGSVRTSQCLEQWQN